MPSVQERVQSGRTRTIYRHLVGDFILNNRLSIAKGSNRCYAKQKFLQTEKFLNLIGIAVLTSLTKTK